MSELKNGVIKKKHIWPSLLLFLIVMCICAGLILASAGVFCMYMMQSKLQQMNDTNKMIGQLVQSNVDGASQDEDGAYLQGVYETFGRSMCVMDDCGNILYQTSRSLPNLQNNLTVDLGNQYTFYEDVEKPVSKDDAFILPMDLIVSELFKPKAKGWSYDAWWSQPLYSLTVWSKYSLSIHYKLYIQNKLSICRQDLYYVCIFSVLAAIVMSVVLLIMFVNTVSVIVNQRKLRNMLYLDPVTGGKNWFHFQGHAGRNAVQAVRKNKQFAIVDIRMDKFESYSACYGAKSADELLKRFSGLLQVRTTRKECFARIAGAQFAMFLLVDSREQCQMRLRSLLAELSGIMQNQKITLATGVIMYEAPETKQRRVEIDIDLLHNYAITARKNAVADGNFPITFFTQDMLSDQLWERKVEDRMEDALSNKEFQVYLQPKYDPNTRRIIGAEALVRWISPEDGIISPGKFIPLFEENGFITKLDDYMLSEIARLQTQWSLEGKKTVPISVNISRIHFAKDNLAQHICNLVDDYGAKHDLIELEVTESAFFDDKETLIGTLNMLKSQGFEISMDDFGAGYSSLNSLKDLPLDVLKLDGEFFRGDFEKERGKIVVRQAISLARSLEMRVVAEGVEKEEQVAFLAKLNCDMIQGFYFAKPMPVAEFEQKLALEA